jgi:hypothetical protein
MGNHFGGPDLGPTEDGRLNIADFYIFRKPADPSKTVMVLDVDPMTSRSDAEFDPEGVYRINVDTDGDALADIAYSVVFSHEHGAPQTATVYRAKGEEARSPEAQGEVVVENAPVSRGTDPVVTTSGDYRLFAGLRSDPFFVDVGIQNDLNFTGKDFFGEANVLAIVLEIPNSSFESSGPVAVWSRTSRRTDEGLVPWDRAGWPGAAQFLARDAKDFFNESEPFQDRERFMDRFTDVLVEAGGYAREQARAIVNAALLPDMLHYDYTSEAGFPNGRKITDDVVDAALAALTNGRVVSDLVGPHDDYLEDFPFLGAPHAAGVKTSG